MKASDMLTICIALCGAAWAAEDYIAPFAACDEFTKAAGKELVTVQALARSLPVIARCGKSPDQILSDHGIIFSSVPHCDFGRGLLETAVRMAKLIEARRAIIHTIRNLPAIRLLEMHLENESDRAQQKLQDTNEHNHEEAALVCGKILGWKSEKQDSPTMRRSMPSLFMWGLRSAWAVDTCSLLQLMAGGPEAGPVPRLLGRALKGIQLKEDVALFERVVTVANIQKCIPWVVGLRTDYWPPNVMSDIVQHPTSLRQMTVARRAVLMAEVTYALIADVAAVIMSPPIAKAIEEAQLDCDRLTWERIYTKVADILPTLAEEWRAHTTAGTKASMRQQSFNAAIVNIIRGEIRAQPRPEPLRAHGISDSPAM
jgi:hypothetical protein